MSSIQICPSILNVDRAHLSLEIEKIQESADLLHLDVMDSIFVPAFTFDFEECKSIIESSKLPVDSHLMIANPDEVAAEYARIGSQSVTFHLEASKSPSQTLRSIRSAGARSSIAIKPNTPVELLFDYLDDADMFLVMTVEPGAGGQSFMVDMMPKVRILRDHISNSGLSRWIQVDGGVTVETIAQAAESGANSFVAGSAVFNTDNPGEAVRALRKVAERTFGA